MILLLNWRVWAALALAAAFAMTGYKGYKLGENSVQVEFDKYKNQQLLDALEAQKAVLAKEHLLQTANEKVTENYESLKTATATAVKSLDADRVRLQSALAAHHSATAGTTETGPIVNDPPESRILGECLQRYEAVAGSSDELSNQVKALQDYVNHIH